jgi:diketogulonate reductase-like aldo/keto reductase
MKVYSLNTGANIPAIGLGTWQGKADHLESVGRLISKLI